MIRRFAPILRYLPRYRRLVVCGLSCLLGSRALALALPMVLGGALDEIARGPDLSPRAVASAAALLLGLAALLGAFHFGMRWFLITTSRRLERDLRREIHGHLLTLSPSFYHPRSTGDLMSRASFDVEQARLAVGPGVMYLANTVVVVPFAVFFLLRMSVPLTLLSLLPLAGIALIARLLAPRMQALSRAVQESAGRLSTRAQESFAGARVVKVFAREENEVGEFSAEAGEYLKASMRLARVNALLRPSLMALEGVGSLVLLVAGGRLIVAGEFTVGDLLAFFAYQRLLIWPMIAIGWVIGLFQRGAAAMARIGEVLSARPAVPPPADPAPAAPVRGDVEFRDFTFSYGREPVLAGVTLRVPAGTSLAIVGATGSGKTTLLESLLRTHPVPEGAVFVDGVDLNRWRPADLRRAIGFVPQETFLFSETIRENIAFGAPGATPEAVAAAAERSGLSEEIRSFPRGFDTLLGERGVNLSGGQKQRVALARALLRDPPLLLLDDAFSAVDTQTEARILAALRHAMRGRTVLFVSHRVSTARHADRIAVLAGGRVAEEGTHEDLLARDGLYADLARRQRLRDELEALA